MRLTVTIKDNEDALAEFCERIGWDETDGSFAEAVMSEILSTLEYDGLEVGTVVEDEEKPKSMHTLERARVQVDQWDNIENGRGPDMEDMRERTFTLIDILRTIVGEN